ncbi:hypothetical protein X271_00141 [Candidatus Hepatoplasma crinochetorum Av]|uniref:Uncharacterized protein n=1 Tax=Candidatus Hepatoplasma crinochetorum Av TaxID=1427984 RepID=W8GS33_9MOLU|nr:hypothetical protein [Candidatus Hepatoplasma crinochetorum]AHK22250.1 hypothetical protein X271_00141 [Candidatus Hepatoplasma crinochetorum Av]
MFFKIKFLKKIKNSPDNNSSVEANTENNKKIWKLKKNVKNYFSSDDLVKHLKKELKDKDEEISKFKKEIKELKTILDKNNKLKLITNKNINNEILLNIFILLNLTKKSIIKDNSYYYKNLKKIIDYFKINNNLDLDFESEKESNNLIYLEILNLFEDFNFISNVGDELNINYKRIVSIDTLKTIEFLIYDKEDL